VEDLRRHGVERVALWPRGVDVVTFSPDHRTRPTGEGRGPVRVGYVGRLAREKQLHLLAGLDRLDGAELVLVGDGPTRRDLERLLPGATFTGVLHGAELSQAYADLDVFVHPGRHETFCQAVQEALASGVPVVAPGSGGPLDLVGDGVNGRLVDPSTTGLGDRLRAGVTELVADPQLRARLAAAARPSVRHRTWYAVIDQLEQHYADVVRSRRGGEVVDLDTARSAVVPSSSGRALAPLLRRVVGG